LARWSMPFGHFPGRNRRQRQHHRCRERDRHPSTVSLAPPLDHKSRRLPSQPISDLRPGGLHDLPKPDSATEKATLQVWHLFLAGRRPKSHVTYGSCRSRLPFYSQPPPNGEQKENKTPRQQTRLDVEALASPSSRALLPALPAPLPRRKSCPSDPMSRQFWDWSGSRCLSLSASSVDLFSKEMGGWGRQ
jgi:hypothetical protein